MRVFVGENAADHGRAFVPGHLHSLSMMAKVIEVETKLSVLFNANDVAKLANESRLAIRRESHHLAFVTVVWKAEELRRRRINDAGRVWVFNLAQHLDRVSLTVR